MAVHYDSQMSTNMVWLDFSGIDSLNTKGEEKNGFRRKVMGDFTKTFLDKHNICINGMDGVKVRIVLNLHISANARVRLG